MKLPYSLAKNFCNYSRVGYFQSWPLLWLISMWLEDAFEKFDKNKDGSLGLKEIQRLLEGLNVKMSPAQVKKKFKVRKVARLAISFEGNTWTGWLHSSGSVYTNAVTNETASISMRLHLLFTRHRSRLLSKPCRFETGAKSGAFSKRCSFICRVNTKTASIWIRLVFWREICTVEFST